MKSSLHITTSIDKPELLKDMIEKLACRHYDIGFSNTPVPTSWTAIETSSIEKYVSGTMTISMNKKVSFKMPFITSFLFTCTKRKNDPYKLNWEISLS